MKFEMQGLNSSVSANAMPESLKYVYLYILSIEKEASELFCFLPKLFTLIGKLFMAEVVPCFGTCTRTDYVKEVIPR